jgi:hypothetical protein
VVHCQERREGGKKREGKGRREERRQQQLISHDNTEATFLTVGLWYQLSLPSPGRK